MPGPRAASWWFAKNKGCLGEHGLRGELFSTQQMEPTWPEKPKGRAECFLSFMLNHPYGLSFCGLFIELPNAAAVTL